MVLAEELHFARCAERPFVSPGRVSQAVKKLEHRFGGTLFGRRAAMWSTAVRQQLFEELLPHTKRSGKPSPTRRQPAGGLAGVVRVGYTTAWSGDLIVRVAREFGAWHPRYDVELKDITHGAAIAALQNTHGAAVAALHNEDVDLLIAERPVEVPAIRVGPVLFSERRALLVPIDHPLAAPESASSEDFAILGERHLSSRRRAGLGSGAMSDQEGSGLSWMGRNASYAHRKDEVSVSGMRACLSLTARRGPDTRRWLERLGAPAPVLDDPVAYRDFVPPPAGKPGHTAGALSVGMIDCCGDWAIIVEDDLAATWYLAQLLDDDLVSPEDEELVCVTLNHHDLPGRIVYSPYRTAASWTTDFGRSFFEDRLTAPRDATGDLRAFDEALAQAGGIHSRMDPVRAWGEVSEDEWATGAYRAVEGRFGISLSRDQVEQGSLPAIVLPLPG
ncbi:LysR family transcriptional regulator [Streptomyces sp. SID14478]|uniref:LysR family transcriptional regulator n=1 Tax=Streptomyces sp. SID14478 TaxID=2706073 RepID=UPI0013DAD258|nr:LysR family transcriptional regulator [Streptomyces sp. SID14478]NEB77416.1 LysR family transcriptional regulator [Streptomyces sp. SID14478]